MSEKEIAHVQAAINEQLNKILQTKSHISEKELAAEKGLIILQYYSTIPFGELDGLPLKERYKRLKEDYAAHGKSEVDMAEIIKGFGK